MIDSLLKFSDPAQAFDAFSFAGMTTMIGEPPVEIILVATHEFSICEIGEHFKETGVMLPNPVPGEPDIPEIVGDGLHWAAYRNIAEDTVPFLLEPFVVWDSSMVDINGVLIPRPLSDPDIPTGFWL